MLLALCVSVGACMPNPAEQVATRNTPFFENSEITNPFETPTIAPVPISNADLVRDFLDLSFSLESGLNLPSFTRFEGPISLRLTGVTSDTLMDDLNRLLLRLEDEAGLEIYFTETESANITIQSLPLAEIQNVLPTAACFVAPNVSSLNEFRRKRYSAETSWSRQKIRQKVGVFLPSDVAPQEIRDCLHEEFA